MKKKLSEMTLEELWQLFPIVLTEYPDAAREYEALKLTLWKEYEHDRDGYTNAKAVLVKQLTEQARRLYGKRY